MPALSPVNLQYEVIKTYLGYEIVSRAESIWEGSGTSPLMRPRTMSPTRFSNQAISSTAFCGMSSISARRTPWKSA